MIKLDINNGDTKHPKKTKSPPESEDEDYSEFSDSDDEAEIFVMEQMTGFF
jgi:hypothetical protein